MKTLFFLLISLSTFATQFVVIVPPQNQTQKVLKSILTQTHQDFRIIYIEDSSYTQNTPSEKIEIYKTENSQTLPLLHQIISTLDPSEVVIYLPNQTWFSHRKVLAEINELYKNSSTWLTYGTSIQHPSYEVSQEREIPTHIIQNNTFRTDLKESIPLHTFYAGLFQKINPDDIPSYSNSLDAIILPMLEMGGKHARFTSKLFITAQTHITNQPDPDLTSKPKYQPISHFLANGPQKKVYITPGYWGALFDNEKPCCDKDDCGSVLCRTRNAAQKRGFDLYQTYSVENLEDFEYLIIFEVFGEQLPQLAKYPKEKLILMLWEPPSVLPANYNPENHKYFSKVYTWHDDLIDNQKYFKFHYASYRPQIPHLVPFDFKRFATLVSANKRSYHPNELYSERVRVIEYFEHFHPQEFELYGKWWPAEYKTYQGTIGDKIGTIKHYKFSFAYENILGVPGYITEKIFDCFIAGSVPIYLGASNINDYIPPNCYIDRSDFTSMDELYIYLKNMPEYEYNQYIENIQNYLNSEKAKLYSIENFVKTFMEILQ